jgi:hypothetical protein
MQLTIDFETPWQGHEIQRGDYVQGKDIRTGEVRTGYVIRVGEKYLCWIYRHKQVI